ncbi:head-tail connector protein [Martelella radicis]|uniref:Putative phiE125 gp8 family phage protein n=1 Tax=Martelella radicis TaxID=1397476 RepID=A0A7W6KHV6_9HYPH|nr:head-tail connector protein [Martelella radicis]MBB4121589.1 putative phiE125 gp8 family phage protein [Martelella radicis]
MSYALITPAAEEPVTLDEAKAFLRLDSSDEDALVGDLITTARDYLEMVTGLSLVTQEWRLYRDDWPTSGMVSLAHGPVTAVGAVTLYDGEGAASAVSLDRARLDGRARPARFYLPDLAGRKTGLNGIEVDFTAGFGPAADVPDVARQAILRHVAHMFAFRGVVAADQQPAGAPDGYDRLIAPLKAWRL